MQQTIVQSSSILIPKEVDELLKYGFQGAGSISDTIMDIAAGIIQADIILATITKEYCYFKSYSL